MVVACELCPKKFKTKYKLRLHMAVHSREKLHKCDMCDKRFTQRWNLITHVSRVHAGHKPFTCADCNKSFGYKSHFKAHVRSHFLDQLPVSADVKDQIRRPHDCTTCGQSFETERLAKLHSMSHTGERPFVCDLCGRQFQTRQRVARHILKKCLKPAVKKQTRRKEQIPCEICGKFIARYTMHKHLNVHTRQRIYPCRTCGKEFLETGHRDVHERTHSGEKQHICEFCGKSYIQKGNLRSHIKRHHNLLNKKPIAKLPEPRKLPPVQVNGLHTIRDFVQMATTWMATTHKKEPSKSQWTKPSKNEVWKKLYSEIKENEAVKLIIENFPEPATDKTVLLLNRLTEIPENKVVNRLADGSLRWSCWNCQMKFKTRYQLIRHMLTHTPVHLRPHRCEICDRRFSQKGNLEHHMLVHKGQHRYTCDKCGLLFRHKPHLDSHWQRRHSDTKIPGKYKCATCDKSTNSRAHLIQHIRTHTREQPYQCEVCGKRFAVSSTYRRHLKTHKTPNEKCLVCGAMFTDKCNRLRHQETHDIRKRHTCKCGKSFSAKSSLRRHEPICEQAKEPAIKAYHCPACPKNFISSAAFKRHAATHNTNKIFSCDFCNLMLKTKETLKRHIQRLHCQ